MPATPKPPFLYAPASESTSKDGLTLAVFTLEDAQPSPFWSTPQALEWAIHPVGVPSSLAGVLPIEPMDSEATYLFMSATQSTLSKELIGPQPPGGLVVWFQSTPTTVVVGLGLYRYTFVLNPSPGESPRVKADVYRGGTRGWQPTGVPGEAVWSLLLWRDWNAPEMAWATSLGIGQELLATHGLAPLKIRHSCSGMFCLVPPGPSLVNRGYMPLGANSKDYRPNVLALQRWLARRWIGASRQHPGLVGARAWLSIHSPMRIARSNQRYVEEGWLKDMGPGGSARFRDPRLLTHRAAALSTAELQDPRQWLGEWFDEGMWRGSEVVMPSLPAARWWLALDAKSTTRLCEATLPLSSWGGLVLTTICHIAAPQGGVRIHRLAALMLSQIPVRFWLAYWMVCEPTAWKEMEASSWERLVSSRAKDREGFFHEIEQAQQLGDSTPQAIASFSWLVRQVLWGTPISDLVGRAEMDGQSLAGPVWDWLWDPANDYGMARSTLSLAEKRWKWKTLVRRYARWLERQEFELAVKMDALSISDKPWPSALGQEVWGECEVYPLRTRTALAKAGQRYLNCMRDPAQLDQCMAHASADTCRWFMLRSPKASVLLQIDKGESGAWGVAQLFSSANRPAPAHLKAVANRVAETYTRLAQVDVEASLKPSLPELTANTSAPFTLQVRRVAAELAHWLELRNGPPAFFDHKDAVSVFTWEELSAPDGMLSCWIQQIRVRMPSDLAVEFIPSTTSLASAVPVIEGPFDSVSALIELLKGHWEQLENLGGPHKRIDITSWVPTP